MAEEDRQARFAAPNGGGRHATPEGRTSLQALHDVAARGGAVCKASNAARMASAHESTAIQRIHDLAAEHGATCSSLPANMPAWAPTFSHVVELVDSPAPDVEHLKGCVLLAGLPATERAELTGTLALAQQLLSGQGTRR